MITVRGRELIIPKSEEQIGTTYDNNSEVRYIRVSRILSGGMDISRLQFKLDVEYADKVLDTCLLDAEVQTDYILLTWTILESCVTTKGTVWIAIRAYDENGTVKWATNKGAVYVGHTIFDGDGYKGKLTELEQLEERIRQRAETLDTNEDERKTTEEQRKANENKRVNNEAEWQRQAQTAINTATETLSVVRTQAGIVDQKTGEALAGATAAAGSATIAGQKEAITTQKAGEASASAVAAAGSATIASQKEAIATQKAGEASASAVAAAGSATIAGQKEAIATQKSGEASASAVAAAGSATIAGQKEAIATQKAGEASGSAAMAARSADRAEQAAGCDGTATSIAATDTHGLGSINVQGQLDSLAAPIFNDSGAVPGISGFQDFINRIASGMGFLDFFRNLKAGLKFVLHTGQLVNNGLCNEPGKYPLDAAYGKKLTDLYAQLNSNLALQQVSNIDIRTLDTGRYYVTNSSNLPTGWIAAYLDVERIDNRWCRITAWPPYKGLDVPQITKQCDGEWLGWERLITDTIIDDYGVLVTDCNVAVTQGNYTVSTTTLNAPTGYGILKVSVSGMWIFQSFRAAEELVDPVEYVRANINNKGWSPWKQQSYN